VNDPKNRNLRSFFETLGIGAVLIGLIFVGIEIRQNTAAIQAATMQGLTDASQEYMLLLGSDAELAEIVRKGRNAPDQLNEIESLQYFWFMRARWMRYQNAFFQYQRGTIGDEDWAFYGSLICGADSNWQNHRAIMSKSFVNYAEACFSDNDRPSIE
jgi:hypothetical protein